MKTLLSYAPLLGCSAMMAVCVVALCRTRLWPRTRPTAPPVDAGITALPNRPAPDVVSELALLRQELEELRRSSRPGTAWTGSPVADG